MAVVVLIILPAARFVLNEDGRAIFSRTPHGFFHVDAGPISMSPKEYSKTCYSLTYKRTSDAAAGRIVVETLSAVIYDLTIVSRDLIIGQDNEAHNH